MRLALLGLPIVILFGVAMLASSAFNYADITPRTVDATIVTDDNAYLAIASSDTDYQCLVGYTNGAIDVTWDNGGGGCAGSGTGLNTNAVYYFHDVLKITNKGQKAIGKIWLNMSAATPITMNINAAASTMTTGDTYADLKTITNLAVGSSYYIGFRIDSTGVNAGSSISRTLSVEARTTT